MKKTLFILIVCFICRGTVFGQSNWQTVYIPQFNGPYAVTGSSIYATDAAVFVHANTYMYPVMMKLTNTSWTHNSGQWSGYQAVDVDNDDYYCYVSHGGGAGITKNSTSTIFGESCFGWELNQVCLGIFLYSFKNKVFFQARHTILDSNHQIISSGESLVISPDGGNTWNFHDNVWNGYLRAMHFSSSLMGIAATFSSAWEWDSTGFYTLYKTYNSGENWQSILQTPIVPRKPIDLQCVSGELFIFSRDKNLLISENGGINWYSTPDAPGEIRDFYFSDENNGYAAMDVGTNRGIYSTTNRGNSWVNENISFSASTSIFYSSKVTGNKNAIWVVGNDSTLYYKSLTTGIDPRNNLFLNQYKLNQNYPNPFNPSTTISCSIPRRSYVEIKIYDVSGKGVAQIVSNMKEAGNYSAVFNGSNLPSGVYFYKLTAGDYTETKKMMLLK